MSKSASGKKEEKKEMVAYASIKNLRVTPQKLNLVADLIRGADVLKALNNLRFCKKRIANDVYKCLHSAINNAEHNHYMDADNLYVSEVFVGKSFVMKRINARARGRAARILKYFSHLKIYVKEREE